MNNKLVKCATVLSLSMSVATATILPSLASVYAEDNGIAVQSSAMATPGGIAQMGNGSATIIIKGNENQSLVGKKFNVYKLFNAQNSKNQESINYTWNPTYKIALQTVVGKYLNKTASTVTEYEVIDYIQTMNTHQKEGAVVDQELESRYSKFRYFVEELRTEIVKENLGADTVTVTATQSNNSVVLNGLDWGYYLTDEVTDSEGTHQAASLCMVNTANPSASVQIKSDYPSLVKKINEDDNNTGWNDIGDYEIGQTVPYKYETTVPNMSGYDTYYLAFHDKMDSALTFNKDSVEITIANAKGKTYTLSGAELSIKENVNGETFVVEIPNLKKIVDTQFPEGLDNNGESTYGQSITVTYNATLNDTASEKTGRPGFENTARLEFSNNPDSDGQGETGYTPWDTVVAFTYKINALKINNHDTKLEGAIFRLYSDKDLQNEVYLKKTNTGYNVINRDSVGGNDHTGGTRPAEATDMVSNAEGVFTIFGLDQGTYYLSEVQAPDGYRRIEDPIVITITPTFTTDRNNYVAGQGATDSTLKSLTATAYIKQFLSGLWKDNTENLTTNVEDGSANITVVNTVNTKLPITGSNGIVVAVGLATGLSALGMVANKKRKEEDK